MDGGGAVTRGDMRARLRARVKEATADNWSDVDMNLYLNLGLQEVQKKIIALDPMAFFWTDRGDIIVTQELYPWPEGCLYEFEVGYLGGGSYKPLERITYAETRDRSAGSDPAYASHGRYFVLSPIPSATVVNGLQVKYMPTLSMSVDADVPKIPQPLHIAAVIYAERFALADVGDVEGRKASSEELAEIINGIPQFYIASASTPGRMRVDYEVGY